MLWSSNPTRSLNVALGCRGLVLSQNLWAATLGYFSRLSLQVAHVVASVLVFTSNTVWFADF